MQIDFHFHSLYSDGSTSLEKIFSYAAQNEAIALALTDHDTIFGIPKEIELSRKYSIPIIPAIELTAIEEGIKFHILGYGIDYTSEALVTYSKEFFKMANEKSAKQIEWMQKNGINIPTEVFLHHAMEGPLYRAKLLGVLAEYGYIKQEDIMGFIKTYFGEDGPYYYEEQFPYFNLREASRLIKKSGGNVVIAHPQKVRNKSTMLYHELLESKEIDGVEIFHPSNDIEVRKELLSLAKERDLLITGGSDYHGAYHKKSISLLGERVPKEVYDNLKHLLI